MDVIGASALGLTVSVKCTQLNQHNENLVQTLNNNQVPANNQVNEYLSGRVTLHGRIIRQLEDDIFDSGEGEIFKSISVLK